MTTSTPTPTFPEYPPAADFRADVSKPLPRIPPGTINPSSITPETSSAAASNALKSFNAALAAGHAKVLADCFYAPQAYWRDIVALTSHVRTLTGAGVVAGGLLTCVGRRGIVEMEMGEASFAVLGPELMFIDVPLSFRTVSPALECAGRMVLLPVEKNGGVTWKIWVLASWAEGLVGAMEDEALLGREGRVVDGGEDIETDVLIVGAGTSGLMTAARLKALGVESVVLERNANIGDNWTNRYDCVSIHVPTSNCELPYTTFPKEKQSPHRLTKHDLAEHQQNYASQFQLNVLLSTTIQSSIYNPSTKRWTVKTATVKESTPPTYKTITSKHLIQATGLGSSKPYLPSLPSRTLYAGETIHSASYTNARALAIRGVKTVAVIGSANTAFDVMEDCYYSGLATTMVARSPTYVLPYAYLMDPHGIGAYEHMPAEAADRLLCTLPFAVDGQLGRALFGALAGMEGNRYDSLAAAGFPLLTSSDPATNLQHNLLERGGGHYVDVGGAEIIAQGKVQVRGGVQPVAYTATGVLLSDGSALDVDAVVWCTGFADRDVRGTAAEMLGGEGSEPQDELREGLEARENGNVSTRVEDGLQKEREGKEGVLGPAEIAERLDATWGVDSEGEVRGVWKRPLRMENYWVVGGAIMHQRWWSKFVALQIKMDIEGCLPEAWRDTPVV